MRHVRPIRFATATALALALVLPAFGIAALTGTEATAGHAVVTNAAVKGDLLIARAAVDCGRQVWPAIDAACLSPVTDRIVRRPSRLILVDRLAAL